MHVICLFVVKASSECELPKTQTHVLNVRRCVSEMSDTVSRADGRVSACSGEKQTQGRQGKYLLNEGQKC